MTRGAWCCIRDGCISMNRTSDQHGPLVDLGHERPQVPARARNMSPIVPRASIAGRALVAVVAIMTFLASITTGTVLLVSASAAEWQSEVASEITIQVRPAAGRDLDHDTAAVAQAMRAQSGIVEVRPFSTQESAKLLEPWLGSGFSISDLPLPRVIVARVQPGTTLDLAALRSRVTQVAPTASVDDHRAWIERMRSMSGATVLSGIGILALVIDATIISVTFATRGEMAAHLSESLRKLDSSPPDKLLDSARLHLASIDSAKGSITGIACVCSPTIKRPMRRLPCGTASCAARCWQRWSLCSSRQSGLSDSCGSCAAPRLSPLELMASWC